MKKIVFVLKAEVSAIKEITHHRGDDYDYAEITLKDGHVFKYEGELPNNVKKEWLVAYCNDNYHFISKDTPDWTMLIDDLTVAANLLTKGFEPLKTEPFMMNKK